MSTRVIRQTVWAIAMLLLISSQHAGAQTSQSWTELQAGVPHGEVVERSYDSKILGRAQRIWVYTPPAASGAPAGVLICLWGADYREQIPVATVLDNLLSKRAIPPIAAVLVDDNDGRFQEFETTRKTAESLATELVPWIRSTLRVPTDPQHVIVTGYSAAGLASTYAAFAHPEVVGNVLSQSGAFWRAFDGEGAAEKEWLAAHYAATPKRDTRLYMEVGGAETRPTAIGLSLLDANRHLRDVLLKQGYDVKYEEVPGAQHEFGHWRSKFADGVISLTSRWPAPR
jgi:enterochelin esterase-like enzyme